MNTHTVPAHRTAQAVVTLTHNGAPLAHQDVIVEQTKHQFLFGSTWGGSTLALASGELSGQEKEQAEQRNAHFLNLFNMATMPFYWARFEPVRGQPQTQRILAASRWYQEQGCTVKGHPLCWHTLAADWLLSMTPDEIWAELLARIQRDVTAFAGVIDMWDVINEVVIMPVFDKYDNGITRLCQALGRIELVRRVFEATRAANPAATLLLNDFDTSSAYDILVEGCLESGIEIDVIGIQSHMHQGYWGVEKTQRVLRNFERFNLPIHFTETTILSGQIMPREITDLNDYQVDEWPSTPEGESRQAEQVVLHYTTLFAHPQVQAITWWNLSDGGWLNAPAGLLREDFTRKPAYDELEKLIKGEWWLPPTRMTTDANGQIAVVGCLGDYQVSVGREQAAFTLPQAGEVALSISL